MSRMHRLWCNSYPHLNFMTRQNLRDQVSRSENQESNNSFEKQKVYKNKLKNSNNEARLEWVLHDGHQWHDVEQADAYHKDTTAFYDIDEDTDRITCRRALKNNL